MIEKYGLEPLDCEGTHFEIGLYYGKTRKSSVQRSVDLMESLLRYSPWSIDRKEITRTVMKFLDIVEAFDPDGVAFVRGQAEGAGVRFEEAFALRCILEIMINYQSLSAMCTSFAIGGSATETGKTIVGQNVDWHRESPVDLLRIRYQNGVKAFSIFLCGASYYHMTSTGLANCANMTVNMKQPSGAHVPISFYIAKAMHQNNLRDAGDILKRAARGYGYCHIADADGNMIGIESVDNHLMELQPSNHILVHANHYESDCFKEGDLYSHIAPCSPNRAKRMRAFIDKHHGSITPEHMMQILRDHQNHPHSICRHINETDPVTMPSDSRTSFIMIPEDGRLLITNGPPCENEYSEYQL